MDKELLDSILKYDPETGKFTWTRSMGTRAMEGAIAGSIDSKGYERIKVRGKLYSSHRLAFLAVNGKLPTEQVDHINKNKLDNRWCNLRECTNSQNQHNQGARSNSSTGHKCVHKHRSGFCVRVRTPEGEYYKFFKELDEAIDHSKLVIKNLHKEFTHSIA
jgi:hypothetical protein